MRIAIVSSGSLNALRGVLALEGDEVVDISNRPDVVIADRLLDNRPACPVIGGDYRFPDLVVRAFGYDHRPEHRVDLLVFRWFDMGWRSQTLVGFPLTTLMNEDLGPRCEAGLACRFIDNVDVKRLFESDQLVESLKRMRYSGFVTFGLSTIPTESNPFGVVSLQTGVPYNGLFNALESVSGKTSDFFTGENPHLLESWTTSLLISRSPFPHAATSDRVFVRGITPDVQKHLWLLDTTSYKKSFYADGTSIALATAWSSTLAEATRRVLRTCRSIDVPFKQFRTDLLTVASAGWRGLHDKALVEM